MSTLDVRKNAPIAPKSTAIAAPQAQTYDPFRMMRDLLAWDPFREMAPFAMPQTASFVPSFEIKETSDGYLFKADVPGIKENDLDVSITGNRLTVSGKRDEEKKQENETYYTYERSYGSFTRSFTLPEGTATSSVNADLKDGVLTISVKKAPEAQAKKVPVQTTATKS